MLEIRDDMEEWGIEVVNIDLINLVKARPLRLIIDLASPRFRSSHCVRDRA